MPSAVKPALGNPTSLDVEIKTDDATGLPVVAALPQITSALLTHGVLVLTAEPGAGKTTRVPLHLCRALGGDKTVIVTEPRRLAAKLAAQYVAGLDGSKLGERVGYSVRFEDVTGPQTRLQFVTEGVLLRQLTNDPWLTSVSAVVLDEFHERHLATDELLALLHDLRRRRPDLLLVVMSATLDARALTEFFGNDCPHVHVAGKSYPLHISHEPEVDERPLDKRVVSAVRRALKEHEAGDILVFLPGSSEIFQAMDALKYAALGPAVFPLYGELSLDEQRAAVTQGASRRIVLSTNVAESSVTVAGVRIVIDSGLVKLNTTSAWTGRAQLVTDYVSKNSAIQRAGRAARQGPGWVYRLYTEAQFKTFIDHDSPEIERTDLAPLLLDLAAIGTTPERLCWLSAPPKPLLSAAQALLRALGAVNKDDTLSPVGKRLASLPLPPRLARVLLEANMLGIEEHGRLAVALLSERDVRMRDNRPSDLPTENSDVIERIDRVYEADFGRERPAPGVDRTRLQAVKRVFEKLRNDRAQPARNDRSLSLAERDERLGKALLSGFGDRVARRKSERGNELTLRDGSAARLSDQSVVRTAPFLIAIDVEDQTRGKTTMPLVRIASAVKPEWLLEQFSSEIDSVEELVFDPTKRRVESCSRLVLDSITLDESRLPAKPSKKASELLLGYARTQKASLFGKNSGIDNLRNRMRLLAQHEPGLGLPPVEQYDDDALLELACEGLVSFQELEALDFGELLLGTINPKQQHSLRALCPENIQLRPGVNLEVHYEADKPPWIAARIQDFFGQQSTPRILNQRVPLTLHLLAPNKRPVQVTNDLDGFWARHYETIRKELRQRYPKHLWPEDGRAAQPPPPGKVR